MGMPMNLKQLEVFIAVAESGSFSLGAEKSFLTQSTVSQHISALESEFGLKLFDRTGKGALPTAAGKLLLKHARSVTDGAREIPVIMDRFKGLESALLSIGGSNIPGSYIIPDILALFHRDHSGVTVTLLQDDSREIVEKLKRDEVELAVIGNCYEEQGIVFDPLESDNIVLVADADHRWKERKEIALSELREESFVLREPGSGTGKAVRESLAAAGYAPDQLKVVAYLGSNESVKQAVINGVGISFVSEMSVRKECTRGELFIVNVGGFAITRRFYLASRRGRELSPAAKAFAALLVQQYPPETE
jgi:DNA-binding transcriptional LysR family regulator